MDAKNLRIGNWVTKQYILDEDGKVFDSQIEITDFMYDKFNEVHEIPLTEEWLIKFGFDKGYSKDESNRIEGWVKDDFFLGGNYEIYYSDDCAIAFEVHQLQNLYFALTGEELTIKP